MKNLYPTQENLVTKKIVSSFPWITSFILNLSKRHFNPRLFMLLLFFVGISGLSQGQLLQWNTYGNAGTETTEPSSYNDANISSSDLNFIGSIVSPAANANRFGGNNWFKTGNTNPSTKAEAIANPSYIQFTVTPNAGYSFTATSFVFSWDKSGTGPSKLVLRSSIDGYNSDLGIVDPVANMGTNNTITISGISNITTATTFRLYGYGATGSGGTGGFDIGTNTVNVQLNGTTASVAPKITSDSTSLSNIFYEEGSGPSSSRSFKISGSNLTGAPGNITLTASANLDVSSDGSTWGSTATVPYSTATLAATTVYTRLKSGLSQGTYASEKITISGGGVSPNVEIPVSAFVKRKLFTTVSDGSWQTAGTWDKGSVPGNGDDVVINHAVTSTVSITRDVGTTTTVNTGKSLAMAQEYINNGTTTINGTFQLNTGGWATGSPFTYGSSGTLVFNTTGNYGVNNDPYWPSTNGPYNVTVNAGGGMTLNVARSINGTFQTSGYINGSGNFTFNGTCQLNEGGNFYDAAVNWGPASTLIYAKNTTHARSFEWNGSTNPANVQLSNNTILNYPAGGTSNRTITGNLSISAGSALYMDYGSPASGGSLTVGGNVTLNGHLSLGSYSGGDIYVGGNWERYSSATFTHNNRAVFFNGQKVQTINAVSGQAANFAYLFVGTGSSTATTVQLGANVNVGTDGQGDTIFSFGNSNDVLDINGKTLTIGKTDVSNTISVTGSFKGSSTSNLEIRGKDGIPTIKFASGGQELNNFKFYRLVAEGYSLGSDLKINGALTIDRGSLYLGNYNLTLGASATVSIPGTPTWGMLITNGTGKVNKIFTAAGSFSFPLGDNTGIREFSPLTIKLTGGTYNSSTMVSAAVKNEVQTFTTNSSTAYIKRYWTTSTTVTGYTSVDATFTYPVADVTGTESNIKLGGWDATAGGWVVGDLTDVPTHTLSLSTATLLDAYTGGNAFSPLISQATDYFRTKTGVGTLWNDKANWESSTDGITWQQSTLYPNTTAANILIKDAMTLNIGRTLNSLTIGNGGKLTLGANLTINNNQSMVINNGGVLYHTTTKNLTVNSGATLTVNNGGTYVLYGDIPTLTGNMVVNSGGIVRADDNSSDKKADDFAESGYTNVSFETGSIYEWNNSLTFATSGITYFPSGSKIPIFRISAIGGNPGGGTATTFNGIVDIKTNVTFIGGSDKNFNKGIIGNSTLTQNTTSGKSFKIGAGAILGGSDLKIVLNTPLNLLGSTEVVAGGNVSISGAKIDNSGILTINGALDVTDVTIGGGSSNTIINGTLKTKNGYGIKGGNSVFGTTGVFSINNGSTIEFYATDDQVLETSVYYYSITLKGGKKTFSSTNPINVNTSGTVTISGNNVYIDATNNNLGPGTGSNSINFNMDGGTLILGTSGAQPNMDGTYNITGGKIIFNRASGLTIRPKIYNQIEIANSTSTSSGGGYLQLIANGSLTVKSGATYEQTSYSIKGVDATGGQKVIVEDGGTFITKSVNGFYGKNGTGSNYSAIHTNIVASNILLAPNSTVNFSATDNQTTTTGGITYGNVTLSGSGQKFFEGVVGIKGNLTAGTDMVLNSTTKGNLVFNGSGDQTVSGAGNLYLHTLEIYKGGGNLSVNRNINLIDNWLTFTQGTLTLGSGVEINMTGGANISANGGDFNSGSLGKIVFKGNSTIGGTGSIHFYPEVYLSPTGIGGVDFGTNNSTIQNLLQLDAGSYVSNHAPSYASGSTLKYNISGAYDRGIEWGTASGAGYPHHVQLTNNVIFNPARGDGSSQNTALNIGGDLTIDAGSELRMDYGVGPVTGMLQPLVVGGNLNINGKLSASIQNGGDIKLKGNWTRGSSGIFEGNDRAVFFIGSGNSDLKVNTTDRTETFPYLIVDKDASSNALNLFDSVKVLKTFTFSKGTLDLKNADFTFVSNATATAYITALNSTDQVINYSGVGRFVVERYLQNHKAWQFLSVPTVGSTFKTAWQENNTPLGNIKPGYGTMLTGTSSTTGYDYTSPQPSLKTFNSATQKYVEVPNTNDSMTSTSGYMVFVRGNRSIAPTSPLFSSTTLRTRGKIYDPSNVPAPITVPANKYALIGNPYPAPITFSSLTTTNIMPSYYLWDPNLAGNYGNGAFQTISGNVVSPGGGGYASWDGNIQSGQAFFVLADTTDGTIEIPETAKQTGGVGSVFATGQSSNYFPPDATSYLRTNLYRINGTDAILLDGVISLFHVEYNPLIDMWDAEKLTNPNSENMSIRSLGYVLSIERTTSRSDVDSIFYKMNNYKIAPYRFVMEGYNLEVEGYDAFLWDKFLNTYTQVNPNGKVNYDFDVKGTPTGSWDENRFTIVFRSNGTVPVTLTNVKAYTQNKDINVEWTAATESNMKSYTVEVSADGNTFTAGGTLTAKNVDGTVYQWLHKDPGAGIHYYRIKSTGLDGKVTYSKIVNATISGTPTFLVSIYPNPIKDGVMNVQFDQQAAGTYQVRVLNTAGQLLLNTTLTHGGGSASQQVRMPATAVKGVYHVEVWKGDLRVMSEKVVY